MKEIVKDSLKLKTFWQIYKWKDTGDKISAFLQQGGSIEQAIKAFGEPFGVEEIEGNLGLNEGIQLALEIIAGIDTSSAKWSNASAYLGVGDSNAAEAATQTGLQAATNKTYKVMDATYPQRTNQTLEWRATFGSADANYAWEEYTVVNASTDTGKNLNRKISSKGTKASGESWVLVLQITMS